jgi:nucleotide-binding universal stress UspA family protein
MYRSLLVPLDGSTFGEHALPLALSIARRSGAKLILAHVHTPLANIYAEGAYFPNDDLDVHNRAEKRAYLDSVVKRLANIFPVAVTPLLLDGEVAAAIQDHAAKSGVDLVVMTTHGRGPLGRFWLGSVADRLVRQLPIPLLLVHPSATAPDLGNEPVLKHILVPLDGSPLAERIIAPATDLGGLTGADYTLLRVMTPLRHTRFEPEGASVTQIADSILRHLEEIQAGLQKEAQTYLSNVADKLRVRGHQVHTRVAIEEYPAEAILKEAATWPTNLIALETHGRGGLSRLMLGSVADKVLRGSSVPLLVHHPVE